MELCDYNGWENKFTWLVHLHLSSEESLMQEMTSLVANTPTGYPVGVLMNEAPDAYTCADTLKDWFEAQMNAWIDTSAIRRQRNAVISMVVYTLIQNTYTVINWDHVARAFQPGY